MNCEICGKSFTGAFNYQQHMASEKHKKKQRQYLPSEIHNFITENGMHADVNNESFVCSVCEVSYYDFSSFQVHVVSLEHANMVKNSHQKEEREASELDTVGGITCSQYIKSELEISLSKEPSIVPIIPEYGNYGAPYRHCQPCNKEFSGPEPYHQHLKSKVHIKNTGTQESGNKLLHVFMCETCDKHCSGIVPYEQHLKSELHKKKVDNKILLSQFKSGESSMNCSVTSSTDTVSKYNMEKPYQIPCDMNYSCWYCTVCKVECSGPIPYKSHIAGDPHKKNVRREELKKQFQIMSEHNINQPSNFSPTSQEMSSTEKFNPVMQHMENSISNSSKVNEKNQMSSGEVESDVILPGALENFKSLALHNIDLNFFPPNSTLNFDIESNCDSGMKIQVKSELRGEEVHDVNVEQEVDSEKNSYTGFIPSLKTLEF